MHWLRLKSIIIITVAQIMVLIMLTQALQLHMSRLTIDREAGLLDSIVEHDGILDEPKGNAWNDSYEVLINKPPPVSIPVAMYFYVKLNQEGEIFEIMHSGLAEFTDNDARQYAKAVANVSSNASIGGFLVRIAEKPYGKLMVFLRKSNDRIFMRQLVQSNNWFFISTGALMFIISLILSEWAIRPAKAAYKHQRQFISDAGHELKTPLAILTVNIEALESEIGCRKQIEVMKTQVNRMEWLIHDLLTLARASERSGRIFARFVRRKPGCEFDLSSVVLISATEFETRAFEEGRSYEYDVADGVLYHGEGADIRCLTNILIDNAIKYSDKNGSVKVSLAAADGARPVISVYNTGSGIPEKDRAKVFERFYRCDESRTRETGGYGLGLAIAKSIVEKYYGKITIEGKNGEWIRFVVKL